MEKSHIYDLDGVLIGQAALGNPWVFSARGDLAGTKSCTEWNGTKEEILAIILRHAELVSKFYSPDRFVTILKHFSWYPREFKNSKKLKVELLKTRNLDEVEKVLKEFI
ncbi:MAG: tRNA-dihydrouridine synthase [Patescibacteria group bacterium]|nr:tRNA-dihydrouridine synthase [Patescibacteria group bacterium]